MRRGNNPILVLWFFSWENHFVKSPALDWMPINACQQSEPDAGGWPTLFSQRREGEGGGLLGEGLGGSDVKIGVAIHDPPTRCSV